MKTAFDTIWIDALINKPRSIGVNPKMASLFEAMCEHVECAYVINDLLTELFIRET